MSEIIDFKSTPKNLLCSVSGGKTSAFMAIFLKETFPDTNILFVFANTGKEREETLQFLKKLQDIKKIPIVWLEALVNPKKGIGTSFKEVSFEKASRNGEPFKEVIKKYGLPSKLYRHCTRELKERPIHKFAKQYFKGEPYFTATGIRADEKHRDSNKKRYWHPLSQINVDKKFIDDWWGRQDFNLDLEDHQGNCDLCFLKSERKRLINIKEGVDPAWWLDMEMLYGDYRQPIFDVRNGLSIRNLIEKAASEEGIENANDVSYNCFCSN